MMMPSKKSIILLMVATVVAPSASAWAQKKAPVAAPPSGPASAPASAPAPGASPASMATSAPVAATSMPTAEVVASRPVEDPRASKHMLLAYLKAGGLIPVSKLGANASVRLGVGYVPPVLKNRLGVVVDLGYSRTTEARTIEDPRLGESGGSYSYDLAQHDLNLFVGPKFFILDPHGRFVPFVGAGLDLHFLKTTVEGQGNEQPLGENEETSTKVGFALRGGAGYRLGPGMLTAEVSFAWADLDHQITGDSSLGRFALLVGYLLDWTL